MHEVIVEKFIASFKAAPEELVLDFDATDDPLYGKQQVLADAHGRASGVTRGARKDR